MGAPGHHRVAVPVRLRGQSAATMRRQLGADQRQAVAHLQHGGGVHDVLRGGAPMRPAARLAGGARQAGDQADDRIADIARAGGEFLGAQVLDARRAGDRFGGVGRE